jgi:hypothetical protein
MLGTSASLAIRFASHSLGGAPHASAIHAGIFKAPDSRLAREAERACAELPSVISAHSYRTWMLGLALAMLDGTPLDPELFYCAALVHDYGLSHPTKNRDFTLASSQRAQECAQSAGRAGSADEIADAICVHPTAGLSIIRDGPIGYYVQWGSMADIAGLRRSEIPGRYLQQIIQLHPRDSDFKRGMIDLVRGEAQAVPKGRFAFYRRWGMTLATRVAPDWR